MEKAITISRAGTPRERARFIKMPWQIYRDDPHWVPPIIADQRQFLDPRRGMFFDHGEAAIFTAARDGVLVGRISAHVNHTHEERFRDGKGFFGFFECVDDQIVADALFRTAEGWLRDRGKRSCEGPLSFAIYDEVGILVDGFDSDPYVLNVHNPPYYPRLVEGAGYRKSVDWYAYRGSFDDYPNLDERLQRLCDRALERSGVTFRALDMRRLDREAEIVKEIFHAAWDENWGHVPFSDREFLRLKDALKMIVAPELSLFAEKDGRPVGIALTLYDANQAARRINGRLYPFVFLTFLRNVRRTDRIRQFAMGVLSEFRGRGIEIALYMTIARRGFQMGLREVEMSLIVENNDAMNDTMKHLPAEIYKTYRIYGKDLE